MRNSKASKEEYLHRKLISDQQKAVLKRFQDRMAELGAQQGHMGPDQFRQQVEEGTHEFLEEAGEVAPHLQHSYNN